MECPYCQGQISQYAQRCSCCGEDIPSGQRFLEESGVIEPAATAAPASAASAPARPSGRYRFASLGDRFIAFVLDTALLFGVFAVVDAWAFMRWGMFNGIELQLTTASIVIAMTLNATILFLYGWLLEAAFGATLGKVLVGIQIIRTTQCSALAACALRNALRIVDGLGFYLIGTIVAACSGGRQRIGDFYAQTAVIEKSFGIGSRVTALVIWIAILAGTGWAVPRICSANGAVHPRYLSQVAVRIGRTANSAYFRIADFTVEVHMSATP